MKFTYFVAIATMIFGMGMAVAIPSDEVAPIPDGEVSHTQIYIPLRREIENVFANS